MRAIDNQYASHEEARQGISDALTAFYSESYPEIAADRADSIDAAAEALGDTYAVNVFPEMQVWWDTYPDHIGHEQSAGCGRCHSRKMRTAERESISSDCDTCHVVLAENERDPEIMTMLTDQ